MGGCWGRGVLGEEGDGMMKEQRKGLADLGSTTTGGTEDTQSIELSEREKGGWGGGKEGVGGWWWGVLWGEVVEGFTFLYSCTASMVLCWSSSIAAYWNSRLCTWGMLYCWARPTAWSHWLRATQHSTARFTSPPCNTPTQVNMKECWPYD